MLRGRLLVPDGADIGLFLLSDGKLDGKLDPSDEPPPLSLGGLFSLYPTQLTAGAKEANTRKCVAIHMPHLARLLGEKTPVPAVTTAAVQGYVDRRAAETYRMKPIKPQTVKKEVATLVTVCNWAHRRVHVPPPCSTKGITFPKEWEKSQFRTYDQVKAILDRGGFAKTEIRELWHSLFLVVRP